MIKRPVHKCYQCYQWWQFWHLEQSFTCWLVTTQWTLLCDVTPLAILNVAIFSQGYFSQGDYAIKKFFTITIISFGLEVCFIRKYKILTWIVYLIVNKLFHRSYCYILLWGFLQSIVGSTVDPTANSEVESAVQFADCGLYYGSSILQQAYCSQKPFQTVNSNQSLDPKECLLIHPVPYLLGLKKFDLANFNKPVTTEKSWLYRLIRLKKWIKFWCRTLVQRLDFPNRYYELEDSTPGLHSNHKKKWSWYQGQLLKIVDSHFPLSAVLVLFFFKCFRQLPVFLSTARAGNVFRSVYQSFCSQGRGRSASKRSMQQKGRSVQPLWYWHLEAATAAVGTHPTKMHSC